MFRKWFKLFDVKFVARCVIQDLMQWALMCSSDLTKRRLGTSSACDFAGLAGAPLMREIVRWGKTDEENLKLLYNLTLDLSSSQYVFYALRLRAKINVSLAWSRTMYTPLTHNCFFAACAFSARKKVLESLW